MRLLNPTDSLHRGQENHSADAESHQLLSMALRRGGIHFNVTEEELKALARGVGDALSLKSLASNASLIGRWRRWACTGGESLGHGIAITPPEQSILPGTLPVVRVMFLSRPLGTEACDESPIQILILIVGPTAKVYRSLCAEICDVFRVREDAAGVSSSAAGASLNWLTSRSSRFNGTSQSRPWN